LISYGKMTAIQAGFGRVVMLRLAIVISALSVGGLALAQGENSSCPATKGKFNAIKVGMTLAEVRKIVGCSGTLLSQSEIAGYTSEGYRWDGVERGSNMILILQNDRVVSKAQAGLTWW